MPYNSMMYQKSQSVQLTLFLPTYFDLVINDRRWELKYPHQIFFGKRTAI